jgi:hypothetical protein
VRWRDPIYLEGELPEDRRLRHARWALALVIAVGVALGAVELPEAAVVLVVAAGVMAWAGQRPN